LLLSGRSFLIRRGILLLLVFLPAIHGCGKKEEPPGQGAPSVKREILASKAVKGAAAPDFTLTDLDGNSVQLSAFKGKVVLVNFWATWCPPCKEEIPSMEKLWQRFGKDGLVILAASVDKVSDEELKNFVREQRMTFPVLRDKSGGKLGDVAEKLYGITGVPESFIVDRQGIIREKIIGSIYWDEPQVLDYFAKLLES